MLMLLAVSILQRFGDLIVGGVVLALVAFGVQNGRGALVEEVDGHDEPLSAPPLDHRTLDTPQRTASDPNGLARFESGLGSERLFGIDETLDTSQIGHERGRITDRQPAGDRVGRQRLPPLFVVDEGKHVAREEWHVGDSCPPAWRP